VARRKADRLRARPFRPIHIDWPSFSQIFQPTDFQFVSYCVGDLELRWGFSFVRPEQAGEVKGKAR
jgi:hypothetical protein